MSRPSMKQEKIQTRAGEAGGGQAGEPALEAQGLSFSYKGNKPVFEDVNLDLSRGEVLTILGPNGAGKSTLLNCLGGILKPTSGVVRLLGDDIAGLEQQEISMRLGYVPQIQSAAMDFTVRDYLVLGRAPYIGRFRSPGREDYEAVERVLSSLDIEKLADKNLQELSGGERQQAHIARALVQQPKILLFDEPTNHLDYGNQIKVLETILELTERDGISVVLTTHTPDFAILLGGKTALLDREGHLRAGSSEDIVTEENLRSIYEADLSMVYVEQVGRKVCAAGALKGRRQGRQDEI